jgi:hypothetical protein
MKCGLLNHNGNRFTPLLVLFGLPFSIQAGFIKVWQLKETASAPVLVTGRVLAVHKNELAPEGSLPWKAETWSMTADIEVLRSYTASAKPLAAMTLRVRFLAYGPSVTTFMNGSPPPLPHIERDEVRIFPLQENDDPASDPWRLTADSGADLTIPTHAELPGDHSPPSPTARAFLIQEIGNTLSHGPRSEVAALSSYLSRQSDDLSAELLPLLEPVVGEDRQRWAEIATSLHAAQGVPKPTVAALFSGKSAALRGNLSLAQAALRKLNSSPETDELLIRTWIADAPFNAWGSANSLVEYAANPTTSEELKQALQADLRGSSYIALVLAHSGNKSILPAAVARAFRVVDSPDAQGEDLIDLQGAAAFLRDYGTDRDLTQLAALVRKYQTLAPKFYGILWQYATESGKPREARVLAVVLNDRRVVSGDLRYCDLALDELQRATGQHFADNRTTLQERDEAVAKGLAWIKAEGLAN